MLFKTESERECDKAIVNIARGDREALAAVYRICGGAVLSVAKSILRDADGAEDVLQETMVRVVRYAGRYRPGSKPRAWVLSIARNCAKDLLASQAPRGSVSLDSEEGEYARNTLSDDKSDFETGVALKDALSTLPQGDAEIVKMKYCCGLSYKEIAAALEIGPAAANKRCQRALKRLRRYFEQELGK